MKRSGNACSTGGAARTDNPPPITAAYKGRRRSAAAIPAASERATSAIVPNRMSGATPERGPICAREMAAGGEALQGSRQH